MPKYLLYEKGIDEYIKMADERYTNGKHLHFDFSHAILYYEHRDNPNYKDFVEKISKGK